MAFKPPVASASVLPASGNSSSDKRLAILEKSVYEWNGTSWTMVGDLTETVLSLEVSE